MSRANYSVSLSAIVAGSAADIAIGQAVTLGADGYYPATLTIRTALGRRADGVSLDAATAGQAFRIAHNGMIDAAESLLAAGAESYVEVNSSGYLARIADVDIVDGTDLIGRATVSGDVHLTPNAIRGGGGGTVDSPATQKKSIVVSSSNTSIKPVAPSHYNVCDYDSVNDITDGTHDATTAINAAIAAANAAGSGVVYFPAGNYRINTVPLTTPGNGVILRGVGSQHAAGAGTVLHVYSVTDSTIYLSQENDANSSRRSGIEGITFRLRVDQSLASEAALQTTGVAAIEIRGGAKFHIFDCKLYDYPIGICLDGAEEVEIWRPSISGVGGGYTSQTTRAYGIWMVGGTSRGKGFTLGGTTNQITVTGGLIEGIWTNIFEEDGVGHLFDGINMEGGTYAFRLGAPQLARYANLTCEGYGSGAYVKVDASSAPSQLSFENCFFGGSTVSLDVSAASASIAHLSMRNCRMGGPNGGSSIVSANRISSAFFDNVYCPQVNVSLVDTGIGGACAGLSKDAVSGASKGLRINDVAPALAVLHGCIINQGDDLLRLDNASTLTMLQWQQPTYQELQMHRRLKAVASSTVTSGDDDCIIHQKVVAGAGASSVFSIAIPDDFCGLAIWEVVGRGGTASNYGIWRRSRSLYRAGGSITFIAAAADDVAAVTSGIAPTAPNIADDGSNNLVLQLSSDATLDVFYVARLRILRAVE